MALSIARARQTSYALRRGCLAHNSEGSLIYIRGLVSLSCQKLKSISFLIISLTQLLDCPLCPLICVVRLAADDLINKQDIQILSIQTHTE